MKKRLIEMLICVVMVLALLPTGVLAVDEVASGTCGENLTWTLDDEGTLTISGNGDMYNYEDILPPWASPMDLHNADSVTNKHSVLTRGY